MPGYNPSAGGGGGGGTLDESYDTGGSGAGRSITADAGPIAITTSGTDAGFQLTDTATTPSTNLAIGQLAIIDGELMQYV